MKSNIKPKSLPAAFGITVRKKRHQLGLSQEEFAEKVDIHRTYVSSIELGKVDVGLTVAQKIAKALNIPLSKLLKDSEAT